MISDGSLQYCSNCEKSDMGVTASHGHAVTTAGEVAVKTSNAVHIIPNDPVEVVLDAVDLRRCRRRTMMLRC